MADPQPQLQDLYGATGDTTSQSSSEVLQALSSIQQHQVQQAYGPSGSTRKLQEGNSDASMTTPTLPSNGSPQSPPTSEFDALFARLKEKQHDPEGWRKLVELAEASAEIDKIRAAFDALLKQYPNTSSAQIRYINHFLADQSTFSEAEELFKKFLRTSPCVDLWKFYLTYVRRLNTSPATRDVVRKSYEFALQHVGQDKESGHIWSDYIQFIKSGEATTTWEEQQKMDALRKVYHRAVQIPLDNVEQLWHDLEAFETNLNKITAKKFMSDLSPGHMQARTTLRQLLGHVSGLYPPSFNNSYPPLPDRSNTELFLPPSPTFDLTERSLVGKWKTYLKWEENNPLEIEDKDKVVFINRVQAVYRKAVIRMRWYSEVWFMAYSWTSSVGRHDEALSILRAGLEANPTSFLLTFAYAEALEARKELTEVHTTFERFLEILRGEIEKLEQEAGIENGKNHNGTATGMAPAGSNMPFDATGGPGTTTNLGGGTASGSSSFNTQISKPSTPAQSELAERRAEYGLAYIVYMRFGRRAGGIKALRAIFGKARRDRWTPWHVFEAAALMEYHCSDDKNVASRIFEKGLDQFVDEIEFVLRYLGFLISINDANNARALFERVIGSFSPEAARPLWERWARYEYQYGDLEGAQKLEKRMAEVYPQDPPMKRFAQRHTYLGVDAIASHDLGFAFAKKPGRPSAGSVSAVSGSQSSVSVSAAGAPLGRTETQQSLLGSGYMSSSGIGGSGTGPGGGLGAGVGHKRPSSPDGYSRKREDSRGQTGGPSVDHGHKRMREMSPMRPERGRMGDRDRDRDRDRGDRERDRERDGRWGEGGPPRRRHSPGWEREKREKEREKEEEKKVPTLPAVLSWFIGELPAASCFDGPVFRTEDLMNLFRNAIIPSSSSLSARPKSPPLLPPPPPPPPPRGRPPPDYSPYQGPGGGRGRRY
ncbi:Suppressor of forked protein (Suf) domain containing protein [Amanita muscaria]